MSAKIASSTSVECLKATKLFFVVQPNIICISPFDQGLKPIFSHWNSVIYFSSPRCLASEKGLLHSFLYVYNPYTICIYVYHINMHTLHPNLMDEMAKTLILLLIRLIKLARPASFPPISITSKTK